MYSGFRRLPHSGVMLYDFPATFTAYKSFPVDSSRTMKVAEYESQPDDTFLQNSLFAQSNSTVTLSSEASYSTSTASFENDTASLLASPTGAIDNLLEEAKALVESENEEPRTGKQGMCKVYNRLSKSRKALVRFVSSVRTETRKAEALCRNGQDCEQITSKFDYMNKAYVGPLLSREGTCGTATTFNLANGVNGVDYFPPRRCLPSSTDCRHWHPAEMGCPYLCAAFDRPWHPFVSLERIPSCPR